MMKACISQVSTLPTLFADDITGYSDGGCQAIEIWLTKLETHLQQHSLSETQQLLRDREMTIAAAGVQGGLLLSQGDERKAHFDHFKKRLELCQQFGIPTLVLVADFASRPDNQALERSVVSLTQAAQWAAGFDVTLALEFRGADAFCSSLDTAISVVAACGEPNVGVCFDVFHYYKGPSKSEDLQKLSLKNLAHVQFCDVAGVPREFMTDSDRVFPGEGDFELNHIVNRLVELNYAGWVSLEIWNAVLWRCKPSQLAELAMTAMTRTLRTATQPA